MPAYTPEPRHVRGVSRITSPLEGPRNTTGGLPRVKAVPLMNQTDALLRGLSINEDQRLGLTPNRIRQIIAEKFNTGRPRERPTIDYADPTGNEAASRADRSRR